jgi:hypothetical protein
MSAERVERKRAAQRFHSIGVTGRPNNRFAVCLYLAVSNAVGAEMIA